MRLRAYPQQRATVRKVQTMENKGTVRRQATTVSGFLPGCFPLGSAQSRAAARSLLEARKASEKGLHFEVRFLVDGKPVNLEGLAETIRDAKGQSKDRPFSIARDFAQRVRLREATAGARSWAQGVFAGTWAATRVPRRDRQPDPDRMPGRQRRPTLRPAPTCDTWAR